MNGGSGIRASGVWLIDLVSISRSFLIKTVSQVIRILQRRSKVNYP